MPYDPGDLLAIKVEIQVNGVWTTITSRARSARKVFIKQAMSDGASGPETSRCRVVVGNDDGWLTEDNPSSPWWPYVGRGTPIRLSLTGILGSDAGRFAGEIDIMEAAYPGGPSSAMYVEAIGTWGTLAQSDEETRSPLYYTMLGGQANDIPAVAYWPMEDGALAAQFASPVAGVADMAVVAPTVLANDSRIVGSFPLPVFGVGAGGRGDIPPHTDTGFWVAQATAMTNNFTFPTMTVMAVDVIGGTAATVFVGYSSTELLMVARDAAGGNIGSQQTDTLDVSPLDVPLSIVVAFRDNASGTDDFLYARAMTGDGTVIASIDYNIGAGVYGRGTAVYPNGKGQLHDEGVIGHVGYYTDPAFTLGQDDVANARAVGGYDGETVEDRVERLCREQDISVTIVGSSTKTMGPQRAGKVTALLTHCQEVDQGIWSDDRTEIGLVYRALSDLYNQTPQVAVTRGSLTPDTRPVWDYQRIRNEWTVSRINGSSSTRSDEDHVAKLRRRLKGSANLNVSADHMLTDQASWRVHVSTAAGPRYPILSLNLRDKDGAILADAVLGMDAGDRMTVDDLALPDQHPPGGADQIVVGWEEELDADFWEFRPVAVPYRPYTVAESDSNTGVAADGSTLSASLTSSATSFSLASTAENGVWTTLAADFPLDVNVGGERITLSAISGTTSPQTATVFARSVNGVVKAHNSGTSVDVWEPAVVAL